MAGFAGFLEFAFVRIEVAVGAGGEFHVVIAWRAAGRIGLVALFAGDLYVQTGEGIARFCVIEILGGFPVLNVVALRALTAELAFVRIVVARGAIGRKAEVGFREVVILDEGFFGGDHVRGCVAFFAGHGAVLALQRITGQTVIEFWRRRFPVDDIEIFAVMFEVASNAVLAGGILHSELKMVAVFCGERLGNFFVAIETLEGGSAGAELVAGIALRGAA